MKGYLGLGGSFYSKSRLTSITVKVGRVFWITRMMTGFINNSYIPTRRTENILAIRREKAFLKRTKWSIAHAPQK
jgi:hypothetical protein